MAKDSLQFPTNFNEILFPFIEIYPGIKLSPCSCDSQFARNENKLSENCKAYYSLFSVKKNPVVFLP